MTDNDLLAEAKQYEGDRGFDADLIRRLAAALRARDSELAAARVQTTRLVDRLLAVVEARPDFTDVGRLQRQAASALTATGLASVVSTPTTTEAEALARRFHETYERLAPSFGYKTREASAVPWKDVPDQNKRLMIAVAAELVPSTPTTTEPLP